MAKPWFVISHSVEDALKRECALRHLRGLPHDQLLAAAESLLTEHIDATKLLSRAVARVAELEVKEALRDAPPAESEPRPWHMELARTLLGRA